MTVPGSRAFLERTLGIARERELPTFRRDTLERWFERRDPGVTAEAADHRVLLFPDTYTNYSAPGPGRAAVRLLEAAGCHVRLATDVAPSGRAAFSLGFLDLARERAEHNVETLAPAVEDSWSVVSVEPADVAMFHDEYADLLDGEAVHAVGANTYGVLEFVDTYRLEEALKFDADAAVAYHGHCNQKALNEVGHAAAVLRRAGFAVDALDSGCCGMAGSFGYEAEHYGLSVAIGDILREQVAASDGDVVTAPAPPAGRSSPTVTNTRPTRWSCWRTHSSDRRDGVSVTTRLA